MLAFDAVPRLLDLSPLHVLWAGHEAVISFFVLSGFVLALPFVDGRRLEYGPYAIKRLLRIYLPYAVAAVVALGLGAHHPPRRARAMLGFEPSLGWDTSFSDSAHFAVMFLVGAALARHRVALDWFRGRSHAQLVGLSTLALTAFAYGRGVRLLPFESMRLVSELGIALGVLIILLAALSSERLARALSRPWLVYNGSISYSFYLWHSVVLFAARHFLVGRIPNAASS